MRITTLRIKNIRSYEDETITLPEGSVLIHGENGAGKTSLLMSIFGGLYQSKITSAGANSFNLDGFVRRGEDKGKIELGFVVDGVEYTALWEIYTTSTASTAELRSSALTDPVSGVRAVGNKITSLLGMDADDFVNSVYVQQGGIDRLIRATNRAEMIDGLLGLDQIDTYIERVKQARRAAGRVEDNASSNADSRRDNIDTRYDRDISEFESEIGKLQSRISTIESKITEGEDYLETLEDRHNEVTDNISDYNDLANQTEELAEEIDKTRDERVKHQQNQSKVSDHVDDLSDRLSESDSEIQSHAEGLDWDVSTQREAMNSLNQARDKLSTAEDQIINERETLQGIKLDLQNEQQELNTLEDEQQENNQEIEEVETQLEQMDNETERLSERVSNLAPEVREQLVQHVPGINIPDDVDLSGAERAPDWDRLPDDDPRSQLDEQISSVEEKLSEEEDAVTRLQTTISTRQDQLRSAEDTVDTEEAEVESARETVDEKESSLSAARSQAETLFAEYQHRWDALTDTADQFGISFHASLQATTVENVNMSSEPAPEVAANNSVQQERCSIQDELQDAKDQRASLEAEIQQLEDDISELRKLSDEGKCPQCRQPVDNDHVFGEIATLREEHEEVSDQLNAIRDRIDRLSSKESSVSDFQSSLEELAAFFRQELSDAIRELSTAESEKDRVEDKLADAQSDLQQAEEAVEEIREQIQTAETTLSKKQDVIPELSGQLDTLEKLRDDVSQLVELYESRQLLRSEIETTTERLDKELEPRADELDSRIEAKCEKVSNLEDQKSAQQETVSQLREEANTIEEKEVEPLDTIVDLYDDRESLAQKLDSKQDELQELSNKIDSLTEEIVTLEDEREDLLDEIGKMDIDELEATEEDLTDKISETKENLENKRDKRNRLNEQRVQLAQRRDQLQDLRARAEAYEQRAEWANQRHDEFDRLLAMYESVKSELRSEYLAYLNQYVGDVFDSLYTNSAYQRIIIDERERVRSDRLDYSIKLQRDDGVMEDPSNASGGERALINLALRTGLYRLIAELQGGNTAELPPLILDEPTTFLDDEHVSQLEGMLDTIRSWNVPQVFVVSHDPSLVDGADHTCEVTIDEISNTSSVTLSNTRTAAEDPVATLTGGDD